MTGEQPSPATEEPAPTPLTPAMQRYLLAIVSVRRASPVTAGAIARELDVAMPTVSEMRRRLLAAGLLERGRYGEGWRLSPRGQRELAAIRRRQSIVERFLHAGLGMDAAQAAEEAAQLSPHVSAQVEDLLRDVVWERSRPCREGTVSGLGASE